jgi:DNA-binding MarR family transcriptional regulator
MFDDLSIVDLLHRASQCAEDIFDHHTRDIDLTARQYAILRAVSKHEGLSQADIVDATGIDRSTVAEMTRRLAKKGLLQRRESLNDARANALRLTAAGRKVTESVAMASRASEEAVYAAIGGLPHAAFRTALIELIATLETARGQADTRRNRRRGGIATSSPKT